MGPWPSSMCCNMIVLMIFLLSNCSNLTQKQAKISTFDPLKLQLCMKFLTPPISNPSPWPCCESREIKFHQTFSDQRRSSSTHSSIEINLHKFFCFSAQDWCDHSQILFAGNLVKATISSSSEFQQTATCLPYNNSLLLQNIFLQLISFLFKLDLIQFQFI